jgi:osmotically inducible protein OsmC
MSISHAHGSWEGTLRAGRGTMKPENGSDVPFSVATRFEGKKGSNPEELVGAALAGCFSMALSLGLEEAGMKPQSIETSANVHLDKEGDGFRISRIELSTEVRASGGDQAKLEAAAEDAKNGCPVSKVLKGTEIVVEAKLVG